MTDLFRPKNKALFQLTIKIKDAIYHVCDISSLIDYMLLLLVPAILLLIKI